MSMVSPDLEVHKDHNLKYGALLQEIEDSPDLFPKSLFVNC
jgi:hypothetical protein